MTLETEKEDIKIEQRASNPFLIYIKSIADIPKISQAEQEQLFLQVAIGKEAAIRLQSTHISPKTRIKLDEDVTCGNEARNAITAANLGLPIATALRHFYYSSVPYVDLIQEGNLALIRSVEKYDPLREITFSSYASRGIRNAMINAAAKQGSGTPMSLDRYRDLHRLMKQKGIFFQREHRMPYDEELVEITGFSLNKIIRLQAFGSPPESLDRLLFENDMPKEKLIGHLQDKEISPEEQVARVLMSEKLADLMERKLTPREEKVLRLKFGWDTGEEVTLQDLGYKYGISRERVRQIEASALKKLKWSI